MVKFRFVNHTTGAIIWIHAYSLRHAFAILREEEPDAVQFQFHGIE